MAETRRIAIGIIVRQILHGSTQGTDTGRWVYRVEQFSEPPTD
jgi:hypothetical protein